MDTNTKRVERATASLFRIAAKLHDDAANAGLEQLAWDALTIQTWAQSVQENLARRGTRGNPRPPGQLALFVEPSLGS